MHDPAPHSHAAHAQLSLAPSLLRLSVVQRFVIAGALAVLLWVAVAWALTRAAA